MAISNGSRYLSDTSSIPVKSGTGEASLPETLDARIASASNNASLTQSVSSTSRQVGVEASTFGGARTFKVAGSGVTASDGVGVISGSDGSFYASYRGEEYPAGSSTFSSPLIPDDVAYTNKVRVTGEHKHYANLITIDDAVFMYVREGFDASNVRLSQGGTAGTGRGMSTNDAKQTMHNSVRDMTIEGFRYGIWKRYSLWDEYRNLKLDGNTCGINLARNSYQADNSNPDAPGTWNLAPGWFHNQLTFDNLLVQGGEAGIIAASMNAIYTNVTCQGQDTDGTSNDVLPGTQQGTGIFLQSGEDGDKGYVNKIVNYYTETTKVGAYIKDQSHVSIYGMFCQGGSSENRMQSAVIADNSVVEVDGFYGQDYFEDAFEAKNGATIFLNSTYGPYAGGTKVDATSRIKYRGIVDKTKFEYKLNKAAGDGYSFAIPHTVPARCMARIYFNGIYDGSSARTEEVVIFNTNSTEPTFVRWMNDTFTSPANVSITVTNAGAITVNLTGAQTMVMYILVDMVGGDGLSGNSVEISGSVIA